jgi:hypothetical protein
MVDVWVVVAALIAFYSFCVVCRVCRACVLSSFFLFSFFVFPLKSISNRVASIGEVPSIVLGGLGFRATPNLLSPTRESKCVFVDVGVRSLYDRTTSLSSASGSSSFRSAVEVSKTINTQNLDEPYQISALTYLNSTHVTCPVPNTKGIALTLLVGVTHGYCTASPNASDLCNQVSRLQEHVSFTYVANTTVVLPAQGPQGSDTLIAISGYGFGRIDRYQTITTTGSGLQKGLDYKCKIGGLGVGGGVRWGVD